MFNNVTQCTAFDGPDKVVAHAFRLKTGIIHFEDAETWTDELSSPSWEKDRFACALHEGHVVGSGSFYGTRISNVAHTYKWSS
jgi:Matrixin